MSFTAKPETWFDEGTEAWQVGEPFHGAALFAGTKDGKPDEEICALDEFIATGGTEMAKDGKLRLYEHAVLLHPETDSKGNAKDGGKTEVLVEPSTLLAADDQHAMMLIARGLDEEVMDKLDRVEIIIRPFA